MSITLWCTSLQSTRSRNSTRFRKSTRSRNSTRFRNSIRLEKVPGLTKVPAQEYFKIARSSKKSPGLFFRSIPTDRALPGLYRKKKTLKFRKNEIFRNFHRILINCRGVSEAYCDIVGVVLERILHVFYDLLNIRPESLIFCAILQLKRSIQKMVIFWNLFKKWWYLFTPQNVSLWTFRGFCHRMPKISHSNALYRYPRVIWCS